MFLVVKPFLSIFKTREERSCVGIAYGNQELQHIRQFKNITNVNTMAQ